MPEQKIRSYKILAAVLTITGGLVALVIFALYGVRSSMLANTGVSLTAAILGIAGVIYFLTLHQIASRKHLAFSTLVLTIITAANLILVIATTGGLNSPYYALWPLAIIVAGIFGTAQIFAILGLTLVYYAYELINEGLHLAFIQQHAIQFLITLIAAGLAEWVQTRNRKATANNSKISSLSGQLSAEQLKAEAIMTSINEGVMIIDSQKRIQLFNKAAQQLTGWDGQSALNIDYTPVLQLKTTDDQPLTDQTDPFVEVWRKNTSVMRDNLVITTRGGHKIQLNISISPIYDDNGLTSGAIALFRDISHEKEVERQKDEFVSTASHEMRTPVAAIEGYISLAMNPNVATIDDRAMKYLQKAHETISHLGELFRDLLSVTKAEEGKLNAKLEPVSLGKLLQDVVDDMQFTAKKKNLTLVYQIGQMGGKTIAPLFYVAANGERLREVVMNLIDNAVKFTTEGGIKVTLEGNEKEVRVAISDTGIGIGSEDAPHLFQKFYRIDNSATRTIGGTGLGLYLCRRVIELFNGRIWVESKMGQGSTFKFSLPRMTESEVKKMLEAQNAGPSTGAAGEIVQPGSNENQGEAGSASPRAAPAPAAPAAPPLAQADTDAPGNVQPVPTEPGTPEATPLQAIAEPVPGTENEPGSSGSQPDPQPAQ